MPVVEESLVTAADNLEHQCPKCNKWFKDLILFICPECEKKGWYEIVLSKDWFSKKDKDGSPDWNSVKKDKPQFNTDWSYGRLNIKTMEMERVPISRDGKKWDYLTDLAAKEAEREAVKDADSYSALIRELQNNKKKTIREIQRQVKHAAQVEKEFVKMAKEEQQQQQQQTNPITGGGEK